MKIKHLCFLVLGIALISIVASPVLGWWIEGESPGYWKRQVKGYVDGRGRVHQDITGLTSDINSWWQLNGDTLPTDEGYDAYLMPVSSLDVSMPYGDFTIEDAYTIITDNSYKDLWKPLANWYNWAAGWLPYTDD